MQNHVTCARCGAQFDSDEQLDRHLRDEHGEGGDVTASPFLPSGTTGDPEIQPSYWRQTASFGLVSDGTYAGPIIDVWGAEDAD